MTASDRIRAGFVGLGAMGGPIARRLLDRFGSVAVYDPVPRARDELGAAGAMVCESPAEVAGLSDVVGISVPDASAVTTVVAGADGLLSGGWRGTFVDFSTSGPQAATVLSALPLPHDVSYLDAPVSGGTRRARTGELTIMLAGDERALERGRPLVEAAGSTIVTVGDRPGQAQLAKVINNLLSATAIAATSEALTLGVAGGLDPEQLLRVINAGSGQNTATADKFPRYVLTRSFDFGFRLELMLKDVGLCVGEARRHGQPMILGSAVESLWRLGAAVVGPGADSTQIATMFEDWAGVELHGGEAGR